EPAGEVVVLDAPPLVSENASPEVSGRLLARGDLGGKFAGVLAILPLAVLQPIQLLGRRVALRPAIPRGMTGLVVAVLFALLRSLHPSDNVVHCFSYACRSQVEQLPAERFRSDARPIHQLLDPAHLLLQLSRHGDAQPDRPQRLAHTSPHRVYTGTSFR